MRPIEYQLLYDTELKHWWFRSLRMFLLRFLANQQGIRTPKLALDIGCGTGAWVDTLSQQGFLVIGLDYSPIALAFAKMHTDQPLVRASADRLPFKAELDFVTSINVLEMDSVNPSELVANAVGVLKPGGTGLFMAPAFQWLLSDHDEAVGSIHRYTIRELIALLKDLPVRWTAANYLFFLLFPILALHRMSKPLGNAAPHSDVAMPPAYLNWLFFWVCRLEALFLPWVRFPFGSSVLVRIEKND